MKNVLVFTSTFPSFVQGDATPPFVYELSQRLAQKGLPITVLTPRVPGSKEFEIKDNMKIYRYPYFFKSSREKLNDGAILPNIKKNKRLVFQIPFLLWGGFIALIKVVKKEKIETIHAHWLIPQGLLACIYKKIWDRKIKILCTTHGGDIFGLRGKFGTMLKKFVLNTINQLTVVSTAIKTEVHRLNPPSILPIYVISMGVDIDTFNPKNYDESIRDRYNITGPFLLFVGRLAEKKGVRHLIDAMPKVIKKHPTAKLLIIGGGPLEEELKQQTDRLKINNSIVFVGPIMHQDLPKFFATADIFIGPSVIAKNGDREGLPVTYMEAMASGCFLIGTDLDGNKDIIKDGISGYLVRQNNSKDIEIKILLILELIKSKKISKSNVLEFIEQNFSLSIIGDKYFNLLK